MNNTLWKICDIWQRDDHRVIRYRCLQNLQTKLFSVQSSDFYNLPIDPEQMNAHESQFIELLIEEDPDDRSGSYPTIEDAINAHDTEFK